MNKRINGILVPALPVPMHLGLKQPLCAPWCITRFKGAPFLY